MTRLIPPRLAAVMLSVAVIGMAWMPVSNAQSAPSNRALYELMNRIAQIEQEIRQLRGDLEVYQHRQRQIDRRLDAIEANRSPDTAAGGAAPAPSEAQPENTGTPVGAAAQEPAATEQSATVSAPASASQQEAYDLAFGSLRQGQYERAVDAFQAFLQAYPDSPLAADAQYWLGETYYVTRDFDKAKATFLNLGTQYPKSEKLPDAMLKLGYIYEIQEDRNKARQVLQKLIEMYPNSRAANVAKTLL